MMETSGAAYRFRHTNPNGWPIEDMLVEHWQYSHEKSPQLPSQPQLRDALHALRRSDLPDRLAFVREGREVRFFEGERIVGLLVRSIVATSNYRLVIEGFIAELFRDFKKGELFEHTELIMTILYALKRSDSSLFHDVADAFSDSRIVEIGRIRHFARQLLGQ